MAATGQDVITRFYDAFARRDGQTMASCYTADARFSDPVFPDLRGAEPGAMWTMLTERGNDLEVRLVSHSIEGEHGKANWVADYTFSQTGRKVHNDVSATFRFADGLIAEHRDDFSFYAWARQALGPVGVALGWTPVIRGKVRQQAAAGLRDFIAGGQGTAPTA